MKKFNSNKDNQIVDLEGSNKEPSIILRKCCACGKITNRIELVRILKENKTGQIIINPNNKQFGRSNYICKNNDCFKLALKKKRLKNYSDEIIEKLTNYINSN